MYFLSQGPQWPKHLSTAFAKLVWLKCSKPRTQQLEELTISLCKESRIICSHFLPWRSRRLRMVAPLYFVHHLDPLFLLHTILNCNVCFWSCCLGGWALRNRWDLLEITVSNCLIQLITTLSSFFLWSTISMCRRQILFSLLLNEKLFLQDLSELSSTVSVLFGIITETIRIP